MRTVVIVIDGMDYDLLKKNINNLPFLKKLSVEGSFNKLQSVTPPDSIPAWNTIYTGLTPGEHGVFEFIDYLDALKKDFKCDVNAIKGRTFWDKIGNLGKKVCIVNPFMAYPAWSVNGVMISGPVFQSGDISIYPDEKNKYLHNCPALGGIVSYPTPKTMQSFINENFELTRKQFAFFRKLCKEEKADFNFLGILTSDRLKHFLWRFTDCSDPTYPGDNKFKNSINDFYKLLDDEIKLTFESFPSPAKLIVLSDHGHGRKCTKLFRVNELLRRKGFVKASKPYFFKKSFLLERAKDISLQLAFRLKMENELLAIGKMLPGKKSIKMAKHAVNNDNTLVTIPKFDGMNPYGGICINKKLAGGQYEVLVKQIINTLLEYIDPASGKRVVRWAKPRKEIYNGPFINNFPDIIIGLEEKYGIDWTLYSDIVADNPFHRRISGGHRPFGVFITNLDCSEIPSSVVEISDFIQKIV